MASNPDNRAYKYRWFRWLPRAVFLAAVLAPILEVPFFYLVVMELGPKYWEFGKVPYIIFYLIIAAIAWASPIAGGIFAIVVTPIMVIVTAWMAGMAGMSEFGEKFLALESFLLVLGGILSIIWGILRRRRGHGQQ